MAVGLERSLAADVARRGWLPVGIGLVAAGAAAAIGGAAWHVSGGTSRSDPKDLHETLDTGQAGLIAAHEPNLTGQAGRQRQASQPLSKATDTEAD